MKHTKAKQQKDGANLVDLAIPDFGYRNHACADKRHRLICRWTVTEAASSDGKQLPIFSTRKILQVCGGGGYRLPLEADRETFGEKTRMRLAE